MTAPSRRPEVGSGDVNDDRTSRLWISMIVGGAVVLALGSIWAWQSWSHRSAEPIDDLLPMLTVADDADVDDSAVQDSAGTATTSPTVDGAESSASGALSGPTVAEEGQPAADAQGEASTPAPPIVVHVSGAVALPGVVQLPAGSRVFEAVDLAGGATVDADIDRVNLAAPLVDGERIHVPVSGEEVAPALVPPDRPSTAPAVSLSGTASRAEDVEMLDLNVATEVELQELSGIGPATAEAIVRTREQRGPFLEVDELLEVPGIGDAKLEQLRPYVLVRPGR